MHFSLNHNNVVGSRAVIKEAANESAQANRRLIEHACSVTKTEQRLDAREGIRSDHPKNLVLAENVATGRRFQAGFR